MAGIQPPELPEGPARDFFEALHDLYSSAGQPSVRTIERWIGRNVISHTTIHKALRGPQLPSWEATELIVEELARAAQENVSTTRENFRFLWSRTTRLDKRASEVDQSRANALARPLSESILKTLDEIEYVGAQQEALRAVPTGISDLDLLTGGLRPGTLTVFASGPTVGKTTLALNVCRVAAIKEGLPSAFLSTEMNESELQMRLLSAQARVPLYWIRNGQMQDEDWTRLARVMGEIGGAPIWFSQTPTFDLKALEDQVRMLKAEYDLRLVVIDCLQPFVTASKIAGSASSAREVLWHLRRVALTFNIPVLLTSRVHYKEIHARKRPEVADLQDSEAIFEEVDVLIILHRPDVFDKEHPRAGEIDLIIEKQRNGPTGTVTTAFQGHYSRILDIGGEHWPLEGKTELSEPDGDKSSKASPQESAEGSSQSSD
jgi:replicative DNA helicase